MNIDVDLDDDDDDEEEGGFDDDDDYDSDDFDEDSYESDDPLANAEAEALFEEAWAQSMALEGAAALDVDGQEGGGGAAEESAEESAEAAAARAELREAQRRRLRAQAKGEARLRRRERRREERRGEREAARWRGRAAQWALAFLAYALAQWSYVVWTFFNGVAWRSWRTKISFAIAKTTFALSAAPFFPLTISFIGTLFTHADITAYTAESSFGWANAISATHIVVGAYSAKKVFIFKKN